jgi:hypothetical protein
MARWDWVDGLPERLPLIDDISDHREAILAELMAGKPVDQVFAIYARPPEPAQPVARKR